MRFRVASDASAAESYPVISRRRNVEAPLGRTPNMELRVIEKTDTELRIEIAGEDHTFMNVLKGALLETDDVAAATYDMNPEQSGGQTEPVLTVKSKSGNPLDAIETAAGSITDRTAALRDAVAAA
jgi:DNA-directed RNA polymerase subunit L